jgi:PPOX class probable F420-dependent enzyme
MDDALADTEFYALKTFRANGAPVITPIWLARRDGRWYGYTPSRSGKVARIRRTERIEVANSTFSGDPHAGWFEGSARILSGPRMRTAKRALTRKYGNRFRWFTVLTLLGRPRRRGGAAVGLEIML